MLTRFGFKTALMPSDIIALRFGVAGLVLLPVVFAKASASGNWGRLASCFSLQELVFPMHC